MIGNRYRRAQSMATQFVSAEQGVGFQRRTAEGGLKHAHRRAARNRPWWVRLVRVGTR